MVCSNLDEANSYVSKIVSEVPKVKCSITPEKVATMGETTEKQTAIDICNEVIEKNKPKPVAKPVTPAYYTPPITTGAYANVYNIGANAEIAAKSLGEGKIWPTNSTYVSSNYGWRWGTIHTGIDIAGRWGDPIYAYKTGYVVFSGWAGSYGWMVKVDHGNGMMTWYAHCSQLLVGVGQTVSQGQTIALEGSTGNSTGPHLHFEVRINGAAVNPWGYIA